MVTDEKLSPTRRLLIGAATFVLGTAGFAAGRILLRPVGSVDQPISFNHRLHVEDAGMECSMCHEYYSTGEHSGLPALEFCAECHAEPMTDSAEEQKLVELVSNDSSAEFRKLFRLPDHVFYSHRQHAITAQLECEICHGAVAEMTEPPRKPLVRVTMDTCVNCHAESGVNTDCTDCHR